MKSISFLLSLGVVFCSVVVYGQNGAIDLYRPDKIDDSSTIERISSVAESTTDGLKVETKVTDYRWPGVTWRGSWNLKEYDCVEALVRNDDTVPLKITVRVDDSQSARNNKWPYDIDTLNPGDTKTFVVRFPRQVPQYVIERVYGMRGLPGNIQADTYTGFGTSNSFDRSKVVAIWIYGNKFEKSRKFSVKRISAISSPSGAGTNTLFGMTESQFFPMIDQYGQYKHSEWPGKIHTDSELAAARAKEESDLASCPVLPDRNRFGGWKEGPKRRGTGHFRAEKVNGKWWLIDPEGCLFWSHGVDCVRSGSGTTGISEREHLFEGLPGEDSPLAVFYGKASYAAHGFYAKKSYKTFNFSGANLYRKYGPNWEEEFAQMCHRRLASWGMNTIANWSDPKIYAKGKTPYVTTFSTRSPRIEGSQGFWGKFPDPYHKEFRDGLAKQCESNKSVLEDPWCIGIFVNNEIAWGNDTSLSLAALASPADQPVKIAFVNWLTDKYKKIESLNTVWKCNYKSWNDLLTRTEVPENARKNSDLKTFYTVIAEEYFRVIHEVLRQKAPNKLDLGCRFAWHNEAAVTAATKYVDIVSFNLYQYDISKFVLPRGIDMPCIVGEFHFGALDRGMLHTGLKKTIDQNDRALKYEEYVRGALSNPLMVGTHWFQFGSQATTGRNDGENYQIGLVDLCDSPYPETISAIRRVGKDMYPSRYGGTEP